MTMKTHITFALGITGLALAALKITTGEIVFESQLMLFAFSVILGSLVPDIDKVEGYAKRTISDLLVEMFGHREMAHSLIGIFVVVGFSLLTARGYLNDVALPTAVGFSLGYVLHIIAEMFTIPGVALLIPANKKRFHIIPKRFRFTIHSDKENKFGLIFGFIALATFIFIGATAWK